MQNLPKDMTLRDWFAGMALQGILAGARRVCEDSGDIENLPAILYCDAGEDAYAYADGLLEARKREQPHITCPNCEGTGVYELSR